MTDELKQIKELIAKSDKITVLTGAGMSTASGIADFRSPGGVWSRYKSVTIQEFISDPVKREYYWKYKRETIPFMLEAKPNEAHKALGRLDRQTRLFWLLTQNIDGLHEQGGVNPDRIVNLHGTNREAVCLSCGSVSDIIPVLERIDQGEKVPHCLACGGLLKPNTVSFGQNLNPEHLAIAAQASSECDLFMALGSSLVVQPACSFVEVAHRAGVPVIIMNRDETPYDGIASVRTGRPLAEVLLHVV